MSADWCKSIEDRLSKIEESLEKAQASNDRLIQIVVIGLLAIVGAIVGVKVIP